MIFVNIDPIAFYIGSYPIGWYGIMVALAVLTMVLWLVLWARKDPRITVSTAVNAAIVGIPSGVILSRLLHVIDNWSYYWANPSKIIGGEGLTIWGAVLGAALGIWLYDHFSKHSFAHMADVLAPGIVLAQAIGRVGCTILGDDTGLPTSLPWGFVYTSPNSPSYIMGLTPTHPVVVYEIFYLLIVFGILMWLRKKLQPDGSLFIVYLGLYSIWRIGIDFLRKWPDENMAIFGLHEAQLIGIIVLIACVILLIVRHTRWVKKGEEEPTPVKSKKTKA